MKLNSNTILLIIASLVVVAGAYWYFSSGGEEEQATLTVTGTENEAEAQFQVLISELQKVSFKTDIFSDTRFRALTELTTLVTPETAGRLDPFALIAGVSER